MKEDVVSQIYNLTRDFVLKNGDGGDEGQSASLNKVENLVVRRGYVGERTIHYTHFIRTVYTLYTHCIHPLYTLVYTLYAPFIHIH